MSNEDDDWVEFFGKLAIASGAAILGGLILKALFDKTTQVFRCPNCNLVVSKYTSQCPRCRTFLDWRGIL